MPRRKRNSAPLQRTKRRLESILSIHPNLDLGGGLTTEAYAATINDLEIKLAAYNTALSAIDKLADDVKAAEQTATEMSEKMLLGIGSRYGKTSQEYEMAGGARRRSRRRSIRHTATTATTTNAVSTPSTNGFAASGFTSNGTSVTASYG
ncbi:hypothetical protein H6G89_12205 [Oscillatoria sp. FACHB-1407]|uniref:hypothetical protein n=1 Tax=Oscillatoria sp. FACHB-1407 TaxID=2692847 RepID=UPI001686ED06|nr:hypothetical protein [Oscillatoria sp. FACHB-1407]MBD2461812.1 hypothetical protein [Oscillatoria sp. FACHB-1407]